MPSYSLRLGVTLIMMFTLTSHIYAQDCNCDHIITGNNSVLNVVNASDFNYTPGDVFCINGGDYSAFRLIGFVGSPSAPLTFKNCNGQVRITSPTYTGIQFRESRYIHVTGTGDDNFEYGLQILFSKSGTSGISVAELSSDFEIDHMDISNVGFAGIIAKTDPRCNDPATWRENFLMENIIIHDNYIHDTEGEGMYIGATFGFETSSRVCNGTQRFAHLIDGLRIYDNIIENAGWDGLQVSVANNDAEIYNNLIDGYGTRREGNQNYGLAIGSGTKAKVYNNIILQNPENAIDLQRGISIIDGITGLIIYNNIIERPGGDGIWMHIRMSNASIGDLNQGYYFINNTIIEPGASGIFYNTSIPGGGGPRPEINNAFHNNLIVNPGNNFDNSGFWKRSDDAFIDFNEREQRDAATKSNNLFTRDLPGVQFADADNDNYNITNGSPAIDIGLDVSSFGITSDFNSGARPSGAVFDAGAFEFGATNIAPIARAGNDGNGDLSNITNLDGSGSSDPDGSIVSYQWNQQGGPAVSISNADQAIASFTPTAPGTYVFRLTVTDDLGAVASDVVSITVNASNNPPIANAGPGINGTVNTMINLNGNGSSDPDGSISSYAWTQQSGPGVSINNANQAIANFTPTTAGTYVFRLTVTDNKGATASDQVSATITSVNTPPVAEAGSNINGAVNTSITLDGSNSLDPDGNITSYQWSQQSGPNVTINNSNQVIASFTATVASTYIFRLTVTDNDGATNSDEVSVLVNNSNLPPVANAGGDLNGNVNTLVNLDGTGSSDPDGSINGFQWAQQSGPSVTINNEDQALASFTPIEAGTYIFRLTVTDDNSATNSDQVTVTISSSANVTPVANAGDDINGSINSLVSLDGTGSSDPDGSIITYQWIQRSGPSTTIDDAHQAVASFTPTVPGTYIFRLTVTDNNGATNFDDISVLIDDTSTNLPPIADAGIDQNGQVNEIITLDGSNSSDPEGSTISFVWDQQSGPITSISNADQAIASFLPLESGSYWFLLTVTDNEGLSSTDEIIINIESNPNDFRPPKFFSPNNDGIGDFWEIENVELVNTCMLQIFNSNGQMVYETQPYVNNWDGNNVQNGDYYYVFTCDGDTFASGSLRIIR